MHVAGLAADVGFVDFDIAADFPAVLRLQREPQPVEHEPCGLLSDVQRAAEFVAADAVLAVGEQPECGQPLLKRQRRVLEHGSDLQGELGAGVIAVALPDSRVRQVGHAVGPAARALDDTIGPADGEDRRVAVGVVREVQNRVSECCVAAHESTIRLFSGCVKYVITQIF